MKVQVNPLSEVAQSYQLCDNIWERGHVFPTALETAAKIYHMRPVTFCQCQGESSSTDIYGVLCGFISRQLKCILLTVLLQNQYWV